MQGCLSMGAQKGCQEQRGGEMNYRTNGLNAAQGRWQMLPLKEKPRRDQDPCGDAKLSAFWVRPPPTKFLTSEEP